MNNPGFARQMTTQHLTATSAELGLTKARWQTAGSLLLGLGLTLSLGAQGAEPVAPTPKSPDATGIVTPESVAPAKVEDQRQQEAAPVTAAPAVVSAEEARLNAVLINSLTGIAFTSSPDEAKTQGPVSGVVASADLPLLSTPAFQAEVASNYLNKQVTLASINALNRDVVAFFKANGLPVVDVIVPEQDITAGTLRLIVLQARLGEVKVQGNKYFSGQLLTSQIRTAPGEVITTDGIFTDLNWLNQNPFRRVGLVYARGAEVGTTDVVLQVEDRRPLRFYAGYEDSGTDATGNNRWLAGINWGNAFGLDHQLNYQFTFNEDLENFYAHSGSYLVPLPWRHTLTTYFAYSNSTAEIVTNTLSAEGESYSAGLRYAVPLRSTPRLTHELYAGYDYKFAQNALVFGFLPPLAAAKTEISQFNLGYAANLRDSWGSTSLTATLFASPGDMTPHNDDTAFVKTSLGSEAEYAYGRLTLERVTFLPADFSLVGSVTGQISSSNLLVSEQLGAGGHATVRGYNEREANAEEGFLSRLEIRTPALSLRDLFGVSIPKDELQFLGFWDYAALYRHESIAIPGADDSFFLSAAGVGLRYSVAPYLSLRADYGWQLKDTNFGAQGDSRGHIGVVVSY